MTHLGFFCNFWSRRKHNSEINTSKNNCFNGWSRFQPRFLRFRYLLLVNRSLVNLGSKVCFRLAPLYMRAGRLITMKGWNYGASSLLLLVKKPCIREYCQCRTFFFLFNSRIWIGLYLNLNWFRLSSPLRRSISEFY